MGNKFLANNLIVYIGEEIIILFCKQSIMDKIGFLKCIVQLFLVSYCQFLSVVVALN